MFKESGNLLTDKIPVTRELVDFCWQNEFKICLKTGNYGKDIKVKKSGFPFIKSLVEEFHTLYLNGELPPSYQKIFGSKSEGYVRCVFLRCGLRTLSNKELHKLYPSISSKRRETNLKKYGVGNPLESPEIRDKSRSTNLERYGVEIPLQSPMIKAKVRSTNLERYGVENPMQLPEVRSKLEATMLEKYGVRNISQSREIRKRIADKCVKKFGFPSSAITSKVEDPFGRFSRLQEFRNAKENGMLDEAACLTWVMNAQYGGSYLNEILKELGLKEPTDFSTELKIQAFLESLGVEFIRKARKAHGVRKSKLYYEADFLIPDLKLVIEINGLAFHSVNRAAKGNPKTKKHHFNKFRAFYSAGYQVLSFTDYELDNMWPSVTEIIKFHLGLVRELSDSTKVEYDEFLGYPVEESLNYNFFNKESIDFEKDVEITPKKIGKWVYYDCGRIKNAK